MISGLIFFGIFFLILCVFLVTLTKLKPTLVHLAIHSFSNRKRSTALAIVGLLIGSAIISGSLILGDSMNQMVKTITIENLGELDIVVTSNSFFEYDIYDKLVADSELSEITDRLAPAISVYGSAESMDNERILPKIRVVGYDENSLSFGDFKSKSLKVQPGTEYNQSRLLILNDLAATRLGVEAGEMVKLMLVKPEYSIDTIYLQDFNASNRIELEVSVEDIVFREGFARLQESGRTSFRETAYLPLQYLQEQLGVEGKINRVYISNSGNSENGIKKDSVVESRLETILNDNINTADLGIKFRNVADENYIRYSSKNIFFPGYHLEFLEDISVVEDVSDLSATLTYFVNYLDSDKGNKVWYSTVTGIDTKSTSTISRFKDYSTKEWFSADIGDSEIILDNWTAEALAVDVGDEIELNYMILDRVFKPQFISVNFTVKYIVEKEGVASDRYLMPDFPGIDMDEDLEPLDWADLFYVNRSRVLELKGAFEQHYWTSFRGAPKAFINLDEAKNLWRNDYGDLTSINIYYDAGSVSGISEYQVLLNEITQTLDEYIGYRDAGISIDHVKKDSFDSAEALDIFPQMFLAFGAIIILTGAIFVINIMVTIVFDRRRELGILRAIGSKRKTVAAILTIEGLLYALPASILGALCGIAIAYALSWGLNNIWSDIVEGYSIPFYYSTESLFFGFFGGFVIGLIAVSAASYRMSRESIITTLRASTIGTDASTSLQQKKQVRKTVSIIVFLGSFLIFLGIVLVLLSLSTVGIFDDSIKIITGLIAPVLITFGIILSANTYLLYFGKKLNTGLMSKIIVVLGSLLIIYIIYYSSNAFRDPDVPGLGMFFTSGLLLLLAILMTVLAILFGRGNKPPEENDYSRNYFNRSTSRDMIRLLVERNIMRNKFRTVSTIIMFSLVIFLIFALATNIMLQRAGSVKAADQIGGGFDFYAESTIPINFDINDPSAIASKGISNEVLTGLEFFPLKSVGHEVGKCSNMNAVYPPRIYGVDDRFIDSNDFKFMRTSEENAETQEIWEYLQDFNRNEATVSIIGDYETLIWIYGGDVGSVFELTDDYGNVYKLEVIGIINSPIFAGSFIMAENNFDRLFPLSGELRSFLGITHSAVEDYSNALEWEFREYGFAVTTVNELASESTEFVAAYMSLFQIYLYFGLIVGIAALGMISLKATSERRYEIGVLKAIGFKNRQVFTSFILENTAIGVIGIVIGTVTGILMGYLSYPFWGLASIQFNFEIVLFLIGVIISITVITTLLTLYPALRASKISQAEALKNNE